jgi:glutamate-1-semialdehyde 2,1-aminomutase
MTAVTARAPGTMPAAEILDRAAAIAGRPVRHPDPARMAAARDTFRHRTRRSAALTDRARRCLPGGTEHVDPHSSPYPLFLDHGDGSRVVDVDGNWYVDCILAGGALVLGHNHPGLTAAVVDLLRRRTNFHGHADEAELLAAETICTLFPAAETVRFTSSGAEANLAAARIARAYTGRSTIVKLGGHYHGWGDQFMLDVEVPGSGDFLAGGVPPGHRGHTLVVDPHEPDELEAALAAGDVAALIYEPFGAESGLVPLPEGFHQAASELCAAHGTLLVLDEVVTGTRAGVGGAQSVLGVRPDLFTLGKGLMNGYPSCGAVAGRQDVMAVASVGPGVGGSPRGWTFLGGTLSGNVLSATACHRTLVELTRPGLLDRAVALTARLAEDLNALFANAGAGFFAYAFGTILKIELTAPHAVPVDHPDRFAEVLRRRALLADYMVPVANAGVLSRMGRDMTCCAFTPTDAEMVVMAYERLLDALG